MLDPRILLITTPLYFIFGVFSYLLDTVRGKTKPNRITWFLWALAPLIAFFAELNKGVGLQSIQTFAVGFSPLLIFLASFLNKKSYWKLEKRDLIYGGLSILGVILWGITGEGNIAIFFAILSDGLAGIPTVIKSYYFPETENWKIFLFAALNALVTILTIKKWDFANYGFPIYIFLICSLLFVLIKFKIGKTKSA